MAKRKYESKVLIVFGESKQEITAYDGYPNGDVRLALDGKFTVDVLPAKEGRTNLMLRRA